MDNFTEMLTRIRSMPAQEARRVAANAGIPYGTLRKLRENYTNNPRIKTVEALRRAMDAMETTA